MVTDLKERLIKVAQKAEAEGLCKYKSGNFSLKIKEKGWILITPSGMDRKDLTPEDICVIDLDGKIVECKENLKPSSEYLMHVEAYKAREDVQAIVHTHSKVATSFSVLNKEIPLIVYEAKYIFKKDGKVLVAPFAPPGTEELAKSILGIIKEQNVCLLANHGAVAVSENSIEEALLRAEYLEEVADIYYHALVIGNGNCKEL